MCQFFYLIFSFVTPAYQRALEIFNQSFVVQQRLQDERAVLLDLNKNIPFQEGCVLQPQSC